MYCKLYYVLQQKLDVASYEIYLSVYCTYNIHKSCPLCFWQEAQTFAQLETDMRMRILLRKCILIFLCLNKMLQLFE